MRLNFGTVLMELSFLLSELLVSAVSVYQPHCLNMCYNASLNI